MKYLPKSDNRGFTLIEMLVVIVIISFLAGIVLTGTLGFQASARDTRRVGDLRNTQNYLELYFNKCGHYPGDRNCNVSGVNDWGTLQTVLRETGIIGSDSYLPDDPSRRSGKSYFYGVESDENLEYVIGAELERGNSILDRDADGNVFGVDCGSSGSDKVYCLRSS